MSLTALTPDDRAKLKSVIESGLRVTQEIHDLKEGLKDTVKTVAEELELKPALINKAIRVAFKSSLEQEKDNVLDVEEILVLVGKV